MARFIEETSTRVVQTSVRHSPWLKRIRDAAKPHVKTLAGEGLSANEFFVFATGIFATKILKKIGIYDAIKEDFESQFGPVQEYLEDEQDDNENEETDIVEVQDVEMYGEKG